MAATPLTDKVDELSKLAAMLTERVDTLRKQADGTAAELSRAGSEAAAMKTQVALVQQEVQELKKGREEWGRRLWMILAPLVAAVIGSLLGYYLRK
jgi:phage shock protein A